MNSILPLGNLLRRYDKFETGALPNDIQLTAGIDRWDFPPGARLVVGGMKNRQFSASGSGLECVFDYAEWLDMKAESLKVQATFERVPGAFSFHFGFSSPTNGDPFRLLIVNEHNPPPPLPFASRFVRMDHQNIQDSLDALLLHHLRSNFRLLADRQWQLQPYIKFKSHPAQSLYKDWPADDHPAFGSELDFSNVRKRLRMQQQELKESMDNMNEPLLRPLGKLLGTTNDNLKTFLAFSPGQLTPARFLEYLGELKNSTPDKAWIRQWHNRPDSDQPDEVSSNLQELYDLWCQKQPQDQPMFTMTGKAGTTNYFFDAWNYLKESHTYRASKQGQLENVQKRLVELGQVAYISLLIVDPNQPGGGLEMIRFEGP
jgi:hypothetical protein